MNENYPGSERREFFRYKHEKPINFKIVGASRDKATLSKLVNAVSKNLSASGILFTSKYLPEISSILALDLDYRTTQICKEIEENALIVLDKIVGKVVRIEENDDGQYNVGVAFIKKGDDISAEVSNLVK
ncbi:MAG TPA: PilZ domain-containing protein [Candidatus Omnitrophota bacterium]|nr:PilZ domain-containing protein [Candidatus Omnitrophota bacterium]